MIRSLFPTAYCGIFICCLAQAADDDATAKTLTAAKDEFQKATAKARSALVDELKKKADAVQKAGDLKNLEKVEDEIKAFEEKGELPKAVSTKGYQAEMRAAKVKLEDAYSLAVKEYTMAGKRALAKATQKSLDEFKKGGPIEAVADDKFFMKARDAVNALATTTDPDDNPWFRLKAIHRSAKAVLVMLQIPTCPDEKAAEKLASESLVYLTEAIKSAEAIGNADYARRVTKSQTELRKLMGTTEKSILTNFSGKVDPADRKKRVLNVLNQLASVGEEIDSWKQNASPAIGAGLSDFKKALGNLPK